MTKGKVIWSLFDGSGIMGLPWAEAGHTVYCFNSDDANHGGYFVRMEHKNIHYVDVWINEHFDSLANRLEIHKPGIIFAFPDCTTLAVSGAKHERGEFDRDPSILNAMLVEQLGEKYGCPWMIENPVGKMSTLYRKPDYYFDPYQYGGYFKRIERDYSFHPKMPLLDAYTKKTCIWAGGGFVMPEKRPVEHIGCFWGWKSLGGNSPKTKQLRSLTPRGFARAVFEANKGIIK